MQKHGDKPISHSTAPASVSLELRLSVELQISSACMKRACCSQASACDIAMPPASSQAEHPKHQVPLDSAAISKMLSAFTVVDFTDQPTGLCSSQAAVQSFTYRHCDRKDCLGCHPSCMPRSATNMYNCHFTYGPDLS